MKEKILITGGAGFIGSNLAKSLQDKYDVTVLDDFSVGTIENLKEFNGEIIKQDITSTNSLIDKLNKNFKVIYHLASITDTTFNNDCVMLSKNVCGFENSLFLANKNNAKLIYASSAGVYGNGQTPMSEEQLTSPLNSYSVSKCLIDMISKELIEKKEIVGLRFFNVFGPGEKCKGKSSSMIYQMYKKILAGEGVSLFKCGEQKRDHIYVKDVVSACINAIESKHGIYNVGTGRATSFNELFEILKNYSSKKVNLKYINNPYERFFQKNTQADVTKSNKELFKTDYTLEEAISEYVEFIKKDG